MSRKLIIAVAPVEKDVPAGVKNPATAREVASAAVECWNAGASLVHLLGCEVASPNEARDMLGITRESS